MRCRESEVRLNRPGSRTPTDLEPSHEMRGLAWAHRAWGLGGGLLTQVLGSLHSRVEERRLRFIPGERPKVCVGVCVYGVFGVITATHFISDLLCSRPR